MPSAMATLQTAVSALIHSNFSSGQTGVKLVNPHLLRCLGRFLVVARELRGEPRPQRHEASPRTWCSLSGPTKSPESCRPRRRHCIGAPCFCSSSARSSESGEVLRPGSNSKPRTACPNEHHSHETPPPVMEANPSTASGAIPRSFAPGRRRGDVRYATLTAKRTTSCSERGKWERTGSTRVGLASACVLSTTTTIDLLQRFQVFAFLMGWLKPTTPRRP